MPLPADSIPVVAIEWLWRDRIPLGKVTILAGLADVGKGLLTAWIAARASRGRLPGEMHRQSANALFIAGEDAAGDTVVPRLMAAGADLGRIFFLAPAKDEWFAIPDDLDALRAIIEERDIRLVFIDPLADYLSAAVDEWRQRDMRAALRPLTALAQELGVAIVVVIHFNKRSEGTFRSRLTGSHASSDIARSALLVANDPADPLGDTRTVTAHKHNLSRGGGPLRFRIAARIVKGAGPMPYARDVEDAPDITTADVLDPTTAGATNGTKLDRAKAVISLALRDGEWLPAGDVFEACAAADIGRATAERAKAALEVEHKLGKGRPPTHLWRLPASSLNARAGGAHEGTRNGRDAARHGPFRQDSAESPRVEATRRLIPLNAFTAKAKAGRP